jgi:hypothetical protein
MIPAPNTVTIQAASNADPHLVMVQADRTVATRPIAKNF